MRKVLEELFRDIGLILSDFGFVLLSSAVVFALGNFLSDIAPSASTFAALIVSLTYGVFVLGEIVASFASKLSNYQIIFRVYNRLRLGIRFAFSVFCTPLLLTVIIFIEYVFHWFIIFFHNTDGGKHDLLWLLDYLEIISGNFGAVIFYLSIGFYFLILIRSMINRICRGMANRTVELLGITIFLLFVAISAFTTIKNEGFSPFRGEVYKIVNEKLGIGGIKPSQFNKKGVDENSIGKEDLMPSHHSND